MSFEYVALKLKAIEFTIKKVKEAAVREREETGARLAKNCIWSWKSRTNRMAKRAGIQMDVDGLSQVNAVFSQLLWSLHVIFVYVCT